ncbi:MAG: Uncharacterized protein XE03_1950 [candidate division TA06 bacterium 34_109]|uniref:PBS lyase HEAT domain protein repeat-containing protein n=1 Tax=candidate division TA06 bacterium 34_109 TaxID=1635277 RepID=A0A101HZK9_UNCT6|nr:MAG: Uncharacterized protein XE03_1950 [candidate division TA06 bacterium 34_109]
MKIHIIKRVQDLDWYTGSNFNDLIIFLVWGLALLVILLAIYCFWLRLIYDLRGKKRKKLFSRWEEIIFEYLDRKKLPSEIVESMPKSEYDYFLDFIKDYLIVIKGEDFKRLSVLINQTKLFSYLINKLKQGNSQMRSDAAFFLGLARAYKAKEFLRERLKDRNDSVSYNCALSLAKIGDIDAVSDILIQYRNCKNYSRDSLLCILFEFGNSVCQSLLQHLLKEKEDSLRILIIDVLGHYRYFSAGKAILNLLNLSNNNELRIHCIKAIGRMEYIEALPTLRRCLDEPDCVIRSQAISAIGKIGDITIENKLVEKLGDENWWVRYRAAEALFSTFEQGKESLKDILAHSKNKKAVSAAQVILTEKAMGV